MAATSFMELGILKGPFSQNIGAFERIEVRLANHLVRISSPLLALEYRNHNHDLVITLECYL